LRVQKGLRAHFPGLILEARRRTPPEGPARFGFTATKKIGDAVTRNRAKRRLREAARALAAQALPGCDYVLVARAETAARPWDGLLDDLRKALLRLAPTLSGPADAPEKGPRARAGRDDADG
jgi:ribonuclease P protein component